MALTQIQIIQSLGESMAWFERELNWGVPPTELRHLIGRIGELYSALITNGQMATHVNQKGYDVVSGEGDRVSVKTTASVNPAAHVAFNPNTLEDVDRVIILRVNTEEMQIDTLLNASKEHALKLMGPTNPAGKACIALSKLMKVVKPPSELKIVKSAQHRSYEIRELENGTIEVYLNGVLRSPAKPELRRLATELNLSILNSNGNPHNTRQLGGLVIKALQSGGI